MAKIYLRQIKAGKMTIDDVPEYWRAQVEKLLEEDKAKEAEEAAKRREEEEKAQQSKDALDALHKETEAGQKDGEP